MITRIFPFSFEKSPIVVAPFVALAFGGLLGCTEAADDLRTRVSCADYCSKSFECRGQDPSNDESRACVSNCRDSMENRCGNDNQAAANQAINRCVDRSCAEFRACMVFDAAPECFGFVND